MITEPRTADVPCRGEDWMARVDGDLTLLVRAVLTLTGGYVTELRIYRGTFRIAEVLYPDASTARAAAAGLVAELRRGGVA
jgi:hypothetical protein